MGRNPYILIYGQELTPKQKRDWLAGLTESERETVRVIERGRQAYALAFGMEVSDFMDTPRVPSRQIPIQRNNRYNPRFQNSGRYNPRQYQPAR